MADLTRGEFYIVVRRPDHGSSYGYDVTNREIEHLVPDSSLNLQTTMRGTNSTSLASNLVWYYSYDGELINMTNGRTLSLPQDVTPGTTKASLALKDSSLQQNVTISPSSNYTIVLNSKTYYSHRIKMGNYCLWSDTSSAKITAETPSSDYAAYTWYFIPTSDLQPGILAGNYYKLRIEGLSNLCAYYDQSAPKVKSKSLVVADSVDETNNCIWRAAYATVSGVSAAYFRSAANNSAYLATSSGYSFYVVSDTSYRMAAFTLSDTSFTPVEVIDGYPIRPVTLTLASGGRYLAYTASEQPVPTFKASQDSADAVKVYAVPARPTNMSYPAPTDLSFAAKSGVFELISASGSTGSTPISWKMPASWSPSGTTFFEVRYRTRSNTTSLGWGSWGAWKKWEPILYSFSEGRCFATLNLSSENISGYCELELQLRMVASGFASTYIDSVASWYPTPTGYLSFDICPDGYHVKANQPGRNTRFDITSITRLNTEKLADSIRYNIGSDDYVVSPEKFITPLEYSVAQHMVVTNHLMAPSTLTLESERNIYPNYPSGSAHTTPDITLVDQGNRVIAVVRDYGTTRVFVGDKEHAMCECYPTQGYAAEAGYQAFEVPYPTGKQFLVLAFSATDPLDPTQTWYTGSVEHVAIDMPFHGFYWKGGYLMLSASTSSSTVTTNNSPVYESNVLDNRKREAVSYASAVRVSKAITGAFADADGISPNFADAMLDAGHVVYRSPAGGLHHVAITGCDVTEHNGYTEVQIDMIEEE